MVQSIQRNSERRDQRFLSAAGDPELELQWVALGSEGPPGAIAQDPPAQGAGALLLQAVWRGHLGRVTQLLRQGADVASR